MEAWIGFIKAMVRPFIVAWGAILYGICLLRGMEVPELLAGLVAAVIIEYFGERAVMRFKENSGGSATEGES
jgi:hypothetical protein